MPGHRRGTLGRYYALESFLWRDFGSAGEWAAWTEAQGLGGSSVPGVAAHREAIRLQAALWVLEAANTRNLSNATRIWCPMALCGSRNKMRRHLARAVE